MECELLAIIPARGGSQRIVGKNVADLAGKPLLAHCLTALQEAAVTPHIYVSTDCVDIASVAETWGAGVIWRPASLAHAAASTESALLHALDWLASAKNLTFDTVLALQATSPFCSAATMRNFCQTFKASSPSLDAMFTVSENRGDFWRRVAGDRWSRLFPDAPRRQQEREPLFEENSALYITRARALRETNFILGRWGHQDGFPIPALEAVDINEPIDLEWARFLASRQPQS